MQHNDFWRDYKKKRIVKTKKFQFQTVRRIIYN